MRMNADIRNQLLLRFTNELVKELDEYNKQLFEAKQALVEAFCKTFVDLDLQHISTLPRYLYDRLTTKTTAITIINGPPFFSGAIIHTTNTAQPINTQYTISTEPYNGVYLLPEFAAAKHAYEKQKEKAEENKNTREAFKRLIESFTVVEKLLEVYPAAALFLTDEQKTQLYKKEKRGARKVVIVPDSLKEYGVTLTLEHTFSDKGGE